MYWMLLVRTLKNDEVKSVMYTIHPIFLLVALMFCCNCCSSTEIYVNLTNKTSNTYNLNKLWFCLNFPFFFAWLHLFEVLRETNL